MDCRYHKADNMHGKGAPLFVINNKKVTKYYMNSLTAHIRPVNPDVYMQNAQHDLIMDGTVAT